MDTKSYKPQLCLEATNRFSVILADPMAAACMCRLQQFTAVVHVVRHKVAQRSHPQCTAHCARRRVAYLCAFRQHVGKAAPPPTIQPTQLNPHSLTHTP